MIDPLTWERMEKNIRRNCGEAALQIWERQGWVCAPMVTHHDELAPEPYLRYRLYLPESNRFYQSQYNAYSEGNGLAQIEVRVLMEFTKMCQEEAVSLTYEQMQDCLTEVKLTAAAIPPPASS